MPGFGRIPPLSVADAARIPDPDSGPPKPPSDLDKLLQQHTARVQGQTPQTVLDRLPRLAIIALVLALLVMYIRPSHQPQPAETRRGHQHSLYEYTPCEEMVLGPSIDRFEKLYGHPFYEEAEERKSRSDSMTSRVPFGGRDTWKGPSSTA